MMDARRKGQLGEKATVFPCAVTPSPAAGAEGIIPEMRVAIDRRRGIL